MIFRLKNDELRMKHDEFRLKNVDVYNETTSVPRLVPPPLRAVGHDLHRQ